jgi:hypothetical protein
MYEGWTIIIRPLHRDIQWSIVFQPTNSRLVSLRHSLITSSPLRLGLSRDSSFRGLQPKHCVHYSHPQLSYNPRQIYSPHRYWFDQPYIFEEGCKILFIVDFMQIPVTSFLWSPNIIIRIRFSHIFNRCPSLNRNDQVSHSCKTMDEIAVLYI